MFDFTEGNHLTRSKISPPLSPIVRNGFITFFLRHPAKPHINAPAMNPSQICTRSIAALMACSLLAVAAPSAFAQTPTTATTDPVGFITLNIAGTGGAGGNKVSFKGLGLTQPVVYQGSAETVNVGTKSFTDNEATWTDNQFNGTNGAYFLEIVRPTGQATAAPGEGQTYDIATTVASARTVTTVQSLDPAIVNGAVFKIRKHWTIGSVFGPNNEAGLGGGDITSADQILIYNGIGYDTYYFYDDGVDKVWLDGNGALAVNKTIYPDDGLVIKRAQSAAVNVVLMGAVKTGQTSFPIQAGLNIVSNIYAAPMTLGSSGLYTGNAATGVAGGDITSADQVLIFNGTGYNTYYFYDDGVDQVWLDGNGAVATNVAIPVGTSFIVKRKGATGFNWKAPQHPAVL
jgi:hypothetical protein